LNHLSIALAAVIAGFLGPEIKGWIGLPAAVLFCGLLGYMFGVCEFWFFQSFSLSKSIAPSGKLLTYE
jgi:hypothetical protein